ncbi:MAG: hypothetical protein RLZZ501_1165 [Pseudomonadota bacterium]
MSLYDRVLWQEGMFLQAQHFQQQDRWIEHRLRLLQAGLGGHPWGLRSLTLDTQRQGPGRLTLVAAAGLFPDGTAFDLPGAPPAAEALPPPLELDESAANQVIYLAVPCPAPGAAEAGATGSGVLARLTKTEIEVADTHSGAPEPAVVAVGRLTLRLMRADQDRQGYQCLAIARIRSVGPDRTILLDEQFIPAALNCRAAAPLDRFLGELTGMLEALGEALGGRLAGNAGRALADQGDFLVLQTVNRWLPLIRNWSRQPALHPERLYESLVQIAGEWATFTAPNRRAGDYPPYRHEDPTASFTPLIDDLRRLIPAGMKSGVTEIPLTELRYGVRKGTLPDRALLKSAVFYLVIRAAVPGETLRRHILTKTKIGPLERMPDLVSAAVSGIQLQAMPQAPRQLPFDANAHYFKLDRGSPLWPQLEQSAGFGIHVTDEPAEMVLQLWAVQS